MNDQSPPVSVAPERAGRRFSDSSSSDAGGVLLPTQRSPEIQRRISKAASSARPGIAKARFFEESFRHHLTCVEWEVRWPIRHKKGRTYNPDFWCGALNCFIEVATSLGNISSEWEKWQKAITDGYPLRVFWWMGEEITGILPTSYSHIRHNYE
jgi:hypothetical protein